MYGRMLRVLARSSFLLAVVLGLFFPGQAEAKTKYKAPLQASIIIDADTGAVMQATNADAITHPASLTKMMTLYMLFDQLSAGRMKLDQRLAVSAHAAAQAPSKLALQPGQSIRVEDAILALVTKSANDVAVVIAEAIGGSEDHFGTLMTQRARTLGMGRTVFRNASGLPDSEQITTARDMATLGRSLLRNHPRYFHYFSARTFEWNGDTITNHNRLMLRYNGADGIKTGYIRASGFNLVSSVERGGRRLIGAVMGGRSAASRDRHMEALLDAAFGGRVLPPEERIKEAEDDAPPAAKPAPTKVAKAAKAEAVPDKAKDKEVASGTGVLKFNAGREVAVLKMPTKQDNAEAVKKAGKKSSGKHDEVRGSGDAEIGGWGVQLGAYAAESAARNAVEMATRRHAALLRDGRVVVSSSKTGKKVIYRARVIGITEAQARTVCRKFTGDQGCLVIQPGA